MTVLREMTSPREVGEALPFLATFFLLAEAEGGPRRLGGCGAVRAAAEFPRPKRCGTGSRRKVVCPVQLCGTVLHGE